MFKSTYIAAGGPAKKQELKASKIKMWYLSLAIRRSANSAGGEGGCLKDVWDWQ